MLFFFFKSYIKWIFLKIHFLCFFFGWQNSFFCFVCHKKNGLGLKNKKNIYRNLLAWSFRFLNVSFLETMRIQKNDFLKNMSIIGIMLMIQGKERSPPLKMNHNYSLLTLPLSPNVNPKTLWILTLYTLQNMDWRTFLTLKLSLL